MSRAALRPHPGVRRTAAASMPRCHCPARYQLAFGAQQKGTSFASCLRNPVHHVLAILRLIPPGCLAASTEVERGEAHMNL